MDTVELARWVVTIIVLGFLCLVLVYALARAVSFAYYRTKYEYWRRVDKEMRKGD